MTLIRWVQKYRELKRWKALKAWQASFKERCRTDYQQLFKGNPSPHVFNFYISLCITETDRKFIDQMCENAGEGATAKWLAEQLDVPLERILKT